MRFNSKKITQIIKALGIKLKDDAVDMSKKLPYLRRKTIESLESKSN